MNATQQESGHPEIGHTQPRRSESGGSDRRDAAALKLDQGKGSIAPLAGHGSEPCQSCGARPLSVCAALDERDLARLAMMATIVSVAPGQGFIHEGDPADSFFNITAGTARLFKLLYDGRRQITGFARPGQFLGLSANGVYSFGAEAIEPLRLCRFSRKNMHGLLDDFPQMERRLLQSAGNELVAAQEQMLLLGRKTARERLASFLLAQSAAGRPCDCKSAISLPMTRSDIADYLGLTIETVSRTFTRLKSDGLIALPGPHEVTVLRRDRLEQDAGAVG